MSEHNIRDLLITAMLVAGAVACCSFLSRCDHKQIDVTCDIEKRECREYLEKLTK